jgi:hypothetical protein
MPRARRRPPSAKARPPSASKGSNRSPDSVRFHQQGKCHDQNVSLLGARLEHCVDRPSPCRRSNSNRNGNLDCTDRSGHAGRFRPRQHSAAGRRADARRPDAGQPCSRHAAEHRSSAGRHAEWFSNQSCARLSDAGQSRCREPHPGITGAAGFASAATRSHAPDISTLHSAASGQLHSDVATASPETPVNQSLVRRSHPLRGRTGKGSRLMPKWAEFHKFLMFACT